MAAAKMLADATAKMVQAAKGCASSPNDHSQTKALKDAADALRIATAAAEGSTSNPLYHLVCYYITPLTLTGNSSRTLNELQDAARQAATAATQCVNSARNTTPYNTNDITQQSMLSKSRTMTQESIPAVVLALRDSLERPDCPATQQELIKESKKVRHTFNTLSNHDR